jgi:hypothetical protein
MEWKVFKLDELIEHYGDMSSGFQYQTILTKTMICKPLPKLIFRPETTSKREDRED